MTTLANTKQQTRNTNISKQNGLDMTVKDIATTLSYNKTSRSEHNDFNNVTFSDSDEISLDMNQPNVISAKVSHHKVKK